MKSKCFFLFCICFSTILEAQPILKGTVLSYSNESIPFANVRIMENGTLLLGTTADKNGNFELTLPDGLDSINLDITAFGYDRTTLSIPKSSLDNMKLFYIGTKYKDEELVFSAKDAECDIKKGLIRFYSYGIPVVPPDVMEKIIIKNGYFYKVTYLSCNINQNIIESVKQYNDYVYSYLKEIYGKNWNKNIKKDIKKYLRTI